MPQVKFIFEPILPKDGVDFPTKKIRKSIELAQQVMKSKSGPDIKKLLKGTTQGWETRVDFAQAPARSPDRASITVFPRGTGRQVWEWVSEGTRGGYLIAPRTQKVMTLQRYNPRTSVGSLISGGGGRFGETGFVSKPVTHPGIEARDFTKTTKDAYENTFQRDMTNVMKQAFS